MATKLITAFLTNKGNPATGLTPTIKIYSITDTTNTVVVNNAPMLEVGDGIYKYVFTNYDSKLNYVFIVDGGPTLSKGERYQVAVNDSFIEDVSVSVWDELETDHVNTGTFGEAINIIRSTTQTIAVDVLTMKSIIETLLKYESNRTKVDKVNNTLTIYDDDGVTPLKVFDLKDSTGNPSVTEICERVPR
jgi:hypothetical protein